MSRGLETGPDGLPRCWWGAEPEIYRAYHDQEWGRPVTGDARLFEKLVLEGFQAGLSWLTILRKRERFREAFGGFDPAVVAAYGPADVERLLGDAGIVRHRGKIEAAISNAARALEAIEEFGSLAAYVWPMAPPERPAPERPEDVPAVTDASAALSRDLKRRGWRFVGPTTVYAFMQAMGLVNDHLAGCAVRGEVQALREAVGREPGRDAGGAARRPPR
ncbi:MAG: DNA-3-methyladenine glycosylase I [Actinobacteria bacterium]|nr:DNA-3-methyladenine glycosylase I [Actinomycetota bacterium]